jgi:hypothetical protein
LLKESGSTGRVMILTDDIVIFTGKIVIFTGESMIFTGKILPPKSGLLLAKQ